MDSIEMKTVVLKIPVSVLERLSVYAHSDNDRKFLINTAILDYLSKREARTARADEQKRKRAIS